MNYFAGFVLSAAFLAGSAAAGDWPQWRGPERTGHVPGGWPVPATLPAEAKIVWHVNVGNGLASPVIAAGKLYYLDNQTNQECVHALAAATGKELWRATLDDAFKDDQTPAGPRCTPVVEGDRLYVQSCRGEFQCLNVSNGQILWRVNFVKDFGATFIGEKGSAQGAVRHGYTASPLIDGDGIIVTAGGTNGASLVKFEKKTGKVIWKSQNDIPAYAAPVIANIAGTRQLLCFMVPGVVAVKPEDGQLLWRVPVKTSLGRHVTTPVAANDMVMVASHQAGLIGIKVTREGNGLKAAQAWVRKESAINFSSPVVVGRYLYGVGPARNLICIDTETGNRLWSKEGCLGGSGGNAHASFLVMGEKILALTNKGELLLIAANPSEFRELSRLQVCGVTWCNPAYADGKLYLRDNRQLLCANVLVP